ncbi:MAG: sterol-binding protein [Actinomycetia bacterium]|nr:sterol-binding protein [Actinomycetes bacterium]
MATAEECRTALEALAGRLAEIDPQKRAAILADRSLSCTVTDLGITFVTKLGPDGPGPVTEAGPDDPPAQVRFSASGDELLAVAGDPKRFARSWLTGRVKVGASLTDLLRLRKLL